MTDYRDVDVQVHTAVDAEDAVPLKQLQDMVSKGISYKGAIAPTNAAPVGPSKGDLYVISAAGKFTDPSWGALQGQTANTHDVVLFEGGRWDLIGAAVDTQHVVEVKGANGIQVTGNINNPVVGLPNGAINQVLAFDGTSWAPANANVISSNTTDIYEHANVTESGDAKPGEVLTFIASPGNPAGGVWSNKAPAAQALDDLSDVDLTINPPLKAGQVLMYEGTGAGLSKWVNVEMGIEDLVNVNDSVTKLGDVLICNSEAVANNIAGWEHRSLEITDLNNVNLSPDWDKINTNTGNVQPRDWMLAFNRQTGKWYNRNLPLEIGVLDSTRLPDDLKALPFYTLEYLQDYNHYIKVDAVFTPYIDSKQNHLFFEMVTQDGGQVDMTKWGIADGGHALTTIVAPSGVVTQERVDAADMASSHFIASSVMICTVPYQEGLQPKKGNPIDLKMSLHFMKGRTAMKIETEYTSSNNSVVNQRYILQSDQVDLLTNKLWRLNWNFVLESHVPNTDPKNVFVSAFSEFA